MTAQPDTGTTEQGEARCYRHPMRVTGVRCIRCDRPICPDCMRPASVGFQCPDDVRMASAEVRPARTVAGARVSAYRAPYATMTLVAANVAIYFITAAQSLDGLNNPSASRLFQSWVLVPRQVALHDQFYRLLTSTFLHMSVVHILFNMLALYIIGPHLERLLGWWRFSAVYLLGALGGSSAVYLFDSKYVAVAGASGAIFGLFAACLLFVSALGFDPRFLIVTVALNFVFTFSIRDVSILGHLGGFVLGAAASFAIAGFPTSLRALGRPRRLPLPVQVYGLVGLFLAVVALIAWRTAVI